MIDVNVNLSRWPFRRLPGDEPASLVAKLRKSNVTQAWAGSFEGVFHKDLASANARLAKDCGAYGPGVLLPFGSVNPKLPDWRDDLRRCHEQHDMRGIRLHPNYHGYKLDDPEFGELLKLAAERKLIVQVALRMEDDRTQHPLMRVPVVDATPLGGIVASLPDLKVVLLNWSPSLALRNLGALSAAGQVYVDLATIESVGAVERLVEQASLARVLFGSHYPFFYFESAVLKVREANLTEAQTKAILAGNAQRLIGR